MAKVKKPSVVKKTLPKLPNLNVIVDNDISNVFVESSEFSSISNIFIENVSDIEKTDTDTDISGIFETETETDISNNQVNYEFEFEFDTDILLEVIEEIEIEQISDSIVEDEDEDDYLTEQVEVFENVTENNIEPVLAEPEIYSFNREKYFTGTHSLYNIKTSNLKSFLIYTNARNPKYIDDIFTQPFHITYNKEILVNYYTNIDTVWIEEQVLVYKEVEYNLSRIEIKFFSI